MSNFGLNLLCVLFLIIYPHHMESVKFLDNDLSVITSQTYVRSKVSQHIRNNRNVPIVVSKRKKRMYLPRHIVLYNGTDNPNKEQKLMVDAFIKSSNGLFKSEMEISEDKGTNLEEGVGACPSKLGLYKSRMENSAKIELGSPQEKVVHTGRMKRYLLDKVGTVRPLDQVRDVHGAKRCYRDRDSNRMCLPKERILRSWQSNLIGSLYTDGLHLLPKLRRRLRSSYNGRKSAFNRRYRNRRLNTLNNTLKGSELGEFGYLNKSEKSFAEFDPGSDAENEQLMTDSEKEKYRKSILRKRYDRMHNPLQKSRCTKPAPTVVIHSVNIGRTGRICFPSTHRCMKMRTCPCSVEYRKCPPRTTCCIVPDTLCFEEHETSTVTTIGRCQGVDTVTPTPLDQDICGTPFLIGVKKLKKRCACDCGCGCPHNLRRNHPDRALARGRCGCGCGCGCLHVEGNSCRTRKPVT